MTHAMWIRAAWATSANVAFFLLGWMARGKRGR